jgi:hypothetical protein
MLGGVETTLRRTVVVADTAPEVPVMTTVAEPVVAVLLADSVSKLVPDVGFGVNDAVTPLGKLDATKLTLPVNPFTLVTTTLVVLEKPWARFKDDGAALRVKLGGPTIKDRAVVTVSGPEVPVIVTL